MKTWYLNRSPFQINLLISQIKKMKNPKIISHRGRSDIYPQNTVEALLQGLLSSDLVEFDVLLTKDNQVIVFHDRFLGHLTNIGFLPEFQNMKTVNNLNEFGEVPHSQWWVKEFTLEEIRKLNVRQPLPSRPQIMDKEFHIPTLDELIKRSLQLKSTQQKGNNSGLLIEVKTQRQNLKVLQRDMILLHKIHEILKANNLDTKEKCEMLNLPITVQSFNQEAVKAFYNLCPTIALAHLYYDEDENLTQEYITSQRNPTSVGLAVSTKHMTRQFVEMCHRMKYEVYYWSVVDDKPDVPFGFQSYEECYQHLKLLSVDGIITDFALNCKKALTAIPL